MDFDKYKNDVPFPGDVPEDIAAKAASTAKTHQEAARIRTEWRRGQRKAHQDEEARLMARFQVDALADVGLTHHPKAKKAFELAWSHGHASGLREVYDHLVELADLLLDWKDVP